MASNTSYETSWADQWDPESLYTTYDTKKSNNGGGASTKFFSTVSDMFHKTKAVASTSVVKVKDGASTGIQWIKDKCHMRNQMDH
ncbi:Hypothetical predicted protein [Olea europaea subsp. europaea]|uniref:Uncharacterized protein n=1 Tax=Olea europaea subsp. europaea TaxID=158383 RepID=A0A8S0RAY8_OLEEU|nr:Hypothetical predicted protein [Olea europaea subsp. europaea]